MAETTPAARSKPAVTARAPDRSIGAMSRLVLLLSLGVLLGASVAIVGCGGGDEGAPGGAELRDRTFVSTKDRSGAGSAFSAPVTVWFEGERRLSWKADCNTAGADVEITADRLIVGQIMSTEIGCPGRPAEQDRDLAAFFESDPRWSLDGDRLILSSDSVEVTLNAADDR